MHMTSPESIIKKQLDAYNAKNIDTWLATYAHDAKQYQFPDTLLTSGHAEIRARTEPRFLEPNLHAKLISRTVIGNIVIDHEEVMRTFPEGAGVIELTCINLVENNKIQTASFIFGKKTML